MDDLQLLSNLYQKYKIKAKETKNWVNYLKVHGLANACLARTSSEEWRQRVYEIENDWYDGKHPLTYTEHLRIIELNNQKLKQLREVSKSNFSGLEDECKKFDMFDTFSSDNLRRMESFADKVFVKSKECSNNIVEFTKGLFSTCVTNLEKVGVVAPCSFDIIGFGSLARGEATPYSDLEYGILIESDSAGTEYFEKLAVESYFRINNLGETPLKCFDIAELKTKAESGIANKFKDSLKCVGLKIDGISPKAGNIPTGNGHNGGNKLIATVDGMMQLYIDKLKAPPGDLTGDLSDLLSTSVLLYSYKGGSHLHREFRQKLIEAYQSNESIKVYGIRGKKLATLVKDIETYNFLPKDDDESAIQQIVGNVKVKTDIFRYPTLLATNLRICLALKTTYPWETFAKLYELQILEKEKNLYLQFILAAAIYIRMSAYLTYESQKEELSFLTPTRQTNDLYYVPPELFVTMSYLLIPMKKTILSSIDKVRRQNELFKENLSQIMKNIFSELNSDNNDFILKTELLQYTGDSEKALHYLIYVFGVQAVYNGHIFLEKLRGKCGMDKAFEARALVVWSDVLYNTTKYTVILDFYTNLIHHSRESISCIQVIARCFEKLHNYQMARKMNTNILSKIRHALEIDKDQPLQDYVIDMLERHPHQLPEHTINKVLLVFETYHALSAVYANLSPLQAENDINYVTAAEQICLVLGKKKYISSDEVQLLLLRCKRSQIYAHLAAHRYEQAVEVYEAMMKEFYRIYGENTSHASIAQCCYAIAAAYDGQGLYSSAKEQCSKALDMFHNIYGKDCKNLEVASCHTNYGMVCSNAGDFAESLEHYKIALDMRLAVCGNESGLPIIAEAYSHMGVACSEGKMFDDSLQYYKKALKIWQKVYGRKLFESDIREAESIANMGWTYFLKKEYKNAQHCMTKAVSEFKTVQHGHGLVADAYYKLGVICYKQGDYVKATCYLEQALQTKTAMFGKDNKLITLCHGALARTYYISGHYKQSLKHIEYFSTNDAENKKVIFDYL